MSYNSGNHYVKGDPYTICDITGEKVRLSQTRENWQGLRVVLDQWEPRQPQDFPKIPRATTVFPECRGPEETGQ